MCEAAGQAGRECNAGIRVAADQAGIGNGGRRIGSLYRDSIAVRVLIHSGNRNATADGGGVSRCHTSLDGPRIDDRAPTYSHALAGLLAGRCERVERADGPRVIQINQPIDIYAIAITRDTVADDQSLVHDGDQLVAIDSVNVDTRAVVP